MPAQLIPLPLETLCAPDFWRVSPSVRVRARPVRVEASVDVQAERAKLWFQALEALPNAGPDALDYDQWFKVIAAIHHETDGAGLEIAQWWSARAAKHDPAFLAERVWPYIKRGDARLGTAVTGGTIMSLASRLVGWSAPAGLEAVDGFVPLDASGRPVAGATAVVYRPSFEGSRLRADETDMTGVAPIVTPAGVRVARDVVADVEETYELADRQGIPPAQHLCTDQANANRLVREYGAHLMVAAGAWYVWDDRCWRREEAGLYRKACVLSTIVMNEAEVLRKRIAALEDGAPGTTEADADERKGARKRLDGAATALEKWSLRSEMKATIEAAVGLARKMLTVEAESLDRNIWLLNVANGTVDLRTGELRPHRIDDRITKITDVVYRPEASSARWRRLLEDVCCGDAALVRFLRRWLGYCCTGSVREQAMAVHWGRGGNGKTTVLEAVADVLGEYAGIAASDLVASRGGSGSGGGGGGGGGAHSSSVVALVGKRLMLAHESDEGAVLREGFIKHATGGERIEARYLYGEQFTFMPTHKLNLVTNHKPTIRGTDEGIWRRMRLMPWTALFGSAEAVARGEATAVRDVGFGAALREKAEKEGILADLVSASREWYRGGEGDGRDAQVGLCEPDVVLAAVEAYRTEQDRIQQFARDCCELGPALACPISDPMGQGIYQQYSAWCKEGGLQPLSKKRFLADLERVVPGFRIRVSDTGSAEKRRKLTLVCGIRVLPE